MAAVGCDALWLSLSPVLWTRRRQCQHRQRHEDDPKMFQSDDCNKAGGKKPSRGTWHRRNFTYFVFLHDDRRVQAACVQELYVR
jgi:hypothetical protein